MSILRALMSYYEHMAAQDKMPPYGWEDMDVHYLLNLDGAGNLTLIQATTATYRCPLHMGRSGKIPAPYFLCDLADYMLGIGLEEEKSIGKFERCRDLHIQLLSGVDSDHARAILTFFKNWDPKKAKDHPAIADLYETLIKNKKMLFRVSGQLVNEDPKIREVWEKHYLSPDDPRGRCSITGREDTVPHVHPSIKRFKGAQAEASLVSFNQNAFCSYGKDQNYNSSVGQHAAFAYTTALNYLLRSKEHRRYIGRDALLFWMNDSVEEIDGFFQEFLFDGKYNSDQLWDKINDLAKGRPVVFDEKKIDPDAPFYLLWLSPNNGRIAVRFFYENTLGDLLKNVCAHHERMRIVKPAWVTRETISICSTVRSILSSSQDISSTGGDSGLFDDPQADRLYAELLRSILTNTPYPGQIMYMNAHTMSRKRRQRKKEGSKSGDEGEDIRPKTTSRVSYIQAALIKAFYLQLQKNVPSGVTYIPEEVLKMGLNPDKDYTPYCLGRLFAVYESVQYLVNKHRNTKLNSAMADRYLTPMAETPALVFSDLAELNRKHMKQLRQQDNGTYVNKDKLIQAIMGKIDYSQIKMQSTIHEKNAFFLGYYHQRQAIMQKEDNENV